MVNIFFFNLFNCVVLWLFDVINEFKFKKFFFVLEGFVLDF